jgi:menaquinone-9 beta-reductase
MDGEKTYSSRILQMAKFFNEGIEKVVYEPPVRNYIGLGPVGTAYTSPAWSMNVVYARLRPRGPITTIILDALLGFFRVSASIAYWYCSGKKASTAQQECRLH